LRDLRSCGVVTAKRASPPDTRGRITRHPIISPPSAIARQHSIRFIFQNDGIADSTGSRKQPRYLKSIGQYNDSPPTYA
jgi:hypothetical protein